ncbi:vesicle-trafficking protein SEC22b-like isoform X2 [Polyodon spathula]|uniref:vesicle-trafficking protein SEC22b-like isoform X2 n=1 Tax=Polyodon spathula TaxID=7913 RepID=UPI001B7E7E2B|nr:vesicle-trafficking protein SEC22b-like isoform X2 [Polyodon spathula]
MTTLTMIARIQDGLLLAASMQESEQSGRNLQEYQNQAKQLFRKLNENSPHRCSLETGPMVFHLLLAQGVCYLVLCEGSYSKRLAFSYLEELQAEFSELYGKRLASVSRPYAFIEFGEKAGLQCIFYYCHLYQGCAECGRVGVSVVKHIHSKAEEELPGLLVSPAPELGQHRAARRAEDHGDQHRGSAAERRGAVSAGLKSQ